MAVQEANISTSPAKSGKKVAAVAAQDANGSISPAGNGKTGSPPAGNGKDEVANTDTQKQSPTENAAPLELGALRQAPMTVQVEVGRTVMTLGEILDDVDVGSSIRLDRRAGEPVEVYVNGALFARAEVVVMQDQIGAKIVEIVDNNRGLRPSGLR